MPPGGSTSRVPRIAAATIGIFDRSAVAKAPPRNLPHLTGGIECSLRKEHEGLPLRSQPPDPAGIGGSFVPIEPLHEGGSEAPQQQTGERHPVHLFLDDEGELGRQGRRGDDAVDVACVIGDDDAGRFRQPIQALDLQAEFRRPGRMRARECRPPVAAPAKAGTKRLTVRAVKARTTNNARQ